MVKYSFVLPVYKVEKYLSQSIESILKQNIKDWELILVDDGSQDMCPQICDDYAKKDKRIKVIHKKNGGVSDARNTGLENSSGRYICFLDPDDYIEPNYLEVIDQNIENTDLLVFSFKNQYINKNSEGFCEENFLDSFVAEEYLVADNKFCGYVWNKVFDNTILKKYNIQFDVSITMNEDMLFCFQYIQKIKKVKLIKNQLIIYRQRKSSLMSQKIKKINVAPLIKIFLYIIENSKNEKVILKCKSLYLKSYYKYIRYISNNEFDMDFVKKIISEDYKNFSSSDKKMIFMYRYFPFVRSILYNVKDFFYKKYD